MTSKMIDFFMKIEGFMDWVMDLIICNLLYLAKWQNANPDGSDFEKISGQAIAAASFAAASASAGTEAKAKRPDSI